MEFSTISLIGIFLLIGIVKKNAILIIDFALDLERSRGLSAREAVREACLLRFRPGRAAAGHRLRRRLRAAPAAGRGHHRRPDRQSALDFADHPRRLHPDGQAAPPRPVRTSIEPSYRTGYRIMKKTTAIRYQPLILSMLAASAISGCALSPAYHVPTTPAPAVYKEAQDWLPAAPADTLERGPWWQLFGDPLLNEMAASIEVNNQNVALAAANYAQAHALVAEQRASLFPSVDLTAGATRSGAGSASAPAGSGSTVGNQYRTALGASWEPDIWGKLRAGVAGASASAQA